MSESEKPNFKETLEFARKLTYFDYEEDLRTDFDVYYDLAKIIKIHELAPNIGQLPVSLNTIIEIRDAEAYRLAQPAHLKDAGYHTEQLQKMLSILGNNPKESN